MVVASSIGAFMSSHPVTGGKLEVILEVIGRKPMANIRKTEYEIKKGPEPVWVEFVSQLCKKAYYSIRQICRKVKFAIPIRQ